VGGDRDSYASLKVEGKLTQEVRKVRVQRGDYGLREGTVGRKYFQGNYFMQKGKGGEEDRNIKVR